jgi:hypothetical protein
MTNLATWTDIAENRAESVHNPKLYLGAGLLGALILGAMLNPATAIAALAWGGYAAWEANEQNSDQVEAVEEGIVAHLLDKKQLRGYLVAVGREQVITELKMAIARELKLSSAAQDLVKRWNLKPADPPTLEALPQAEPTPSAEPAPTVEPAVELPVAWQRIEEPPDMVQVWPRGAGDHPITDSVSATSVMPETENGDASPNRGTPFPTIDPVNLMAQTPFETVGPLRTDEFQLFSVLKSQKRKQTDVIKIMYHVSHGGTDAYRRARDRYMFLLKQYCDANAA